MALPFLYAALATAQVINGANQAESIRASAALNRRVSEMNAKYAEYDAYRAEIEGESEAARYQSLVGRTVADQEAAFISADVDYTFGTAAEVIADTRVRGVMNQMEMRNRATMKAMGYRMEAVNQRFAGIQASANANRSADTAMITGMSSGVSSAVSGYERL